MRFENNPKSENTSEKRELLQLQSYDRVKGIEEVKLDKSTGQLLYYSSEAGDWKIETILSNGWKGGDVNSDVFFELLAVRGSQIPPIVLRRTYQNHQLIKEEDLTPNIEPDK